MVKLNLNNLIKKVSTPILNKFVRGNILARFNIAKKLLIQKFSNHPVTKEIEGGVAAGNISGVVSRGNLYSFIGFDSTSSPILPILTLLESKTFLVMNPKISGLNYSFIVKRPSLEDIYNVSPYPFDSGESWVYGVEFGMSNFNNFMAKKVASSRSGGGIQIQGDLGGESVKKKYMSVLLEEFDEMLKRRDIVIRSGI